MIINEFNVRDAPTDLQMVLEALLEGYALRDLNEKDEELLKAMLEAFPDIGIELLSNIEHNSFCAGAGSLLAPLRAEALESMLRLGRVPSVLSCKF